MKIKLLFVFAIFIVYSNQAQIGFQEHNLYNELDLIGQNSSTYADMDGDGDLDVVFSNGGKISWFENMDGLGTFSRQKVIIQGNIRNYAVVNIDSDNSIDIVFSGNSGIQWLRNLDGEGNFGPPQTIDASETPYSLISTDIDGDGDMDVLVGIASSGVDRISWYENTDGNGTFDSEIQINSTIVSIADVSAADIDGDGDLDLLMTSSEYSGIIIWFKNLDGQGNFGPKQIIASAQGPRYISAVDLDSDGDLDILSTSILDDDIVWYRNNNGQGNFSGNILIVPNLSNVQSVNPVDMDNDGDNDILVDNDGTISWFENTTGLANFGPQKIINMESTIMGSQYPNFEDIDNDGYKDILRSTINNIQWYKNINGMGDFEEGRLIGRYLESPRIVLSSDLNGDGHNDILIGHSEKIIWYQNLDGNGNFGVENLIISNLISTKPYTADIDTDGDIDLIVLERNKISWMENLDGLGTFGPLQEITIEVSFASSVASADLDNDGDLDIISVSVGDDKIAWYENLDGLGQFGPQIIISSNAVESADPLAIDIDNDGDKDIIAAEDFKISLFRNTNGLGDFSSGETIAYAIINANNLFSEDMDGDGDMDLIFTEDSNKLHYYDNLDGLGNFEIKQTVINGGNNAAKIAIVTDLDGDNDFDLVVANNNEVILFDNPDGLGNFEIGSEQILFEEEEAPYSLFINDLNGDGKMDILSALLSRHKLSWYENLGILGNSIMGNIRLDLDMNGCSPSDLPLKNILVTTRNGIYSFASFTNENGDYILNTNEGNFNTNILDALPTYYTSNPSSHDSNFNGLGNLDIADFCAVPNLTTNDLNITIYPLSDARPGFEAEYQIVFNNVGTTVLNGTVTLNFDEMRLDFLTASEPIGSQTNGTITFDYTNFNPFETRSIDVSFQAATPPTSQIGDILVFDITIDPISGDITEADNTFALEQTVIGSYDPNDIQVLEGESIFIDEAEDYLHYIIRFQNTGTASAINVSVSNELDQNLDWTTMQIETISHSNRVEITDGNQVEFIFNNINLPDSTSNEPASHGYIQYKIKPKSTIAVGDFIKNDAAIYFDFNPPVITNTVITTVIEPLGVEENATNSVALYPVPASDILNINSTLPIIDAKVFNNLGQLLFAIGNQRGIEQLNIELLSTGIYFVKLTDLEQNTYTKKFIKQE